MDLVSRITSEANAMKFGKRGTFIPMILILFVTVTWIVQFPSKQIGYLLESDNKMWIKDSESTDNWIEHYEDFIQKATLRNDLFRFNKAIYKTPCGNFKATFRENLDIVMNYRFNVSKELLRNLDLDDAGIRKLSEKESNQIQRTRVLACSVCKSLRGVAGFVQKHSPESDAEIQKYQTCFL